GHRPIFTGDTFAKVTVQSVGDTKVKDVMILQHPCALRSNGVDLHPRLLVAELRKHPVIGVQDWTGHVAKMPLPDLFPTVASGKRNQAAFFAELYLVGTATWTWTSAPPACPRPVSTFYYSVG